MSKTKRPQETDSSLDVHGLRHGVRTLVLKPFLSHRHGVGCPYRDVEPLLLEVVGLSQAIDLIVVEAKSFNLPHPTPSTLLGSGMVQDVARSVESLEIGLIVIDHPLTPIQQRNLEKDCKCKVIDRTGLILEIFGARARTKEGQLQVELAALSYQKSRLVKSWTHLERQRGGFGFLGGPGESQLEIDRRLITRRIVKIKSELEQVRRTRGLQRESRMRSEMPTIALVGYTNAGKSTLFNRLTGAGVFAKDMLFATLDPSMRGCKLPSSTKVIFSDTVGFITDLPTHLIDAFRATLEEVQFADLILHVRDITHPETRMQKESVGAILGDLGIEADDARLIEVMNKADLLEADEYQNLREFASRQSWDSRNALNLDGLNTEARGGSVAVSALTGEGVNDLLVLLDEHLARSVELHNISLPSSEGAALAWLYGHGKVLEKSERKARIHVTVALDQADICRFLNKFGKVAHVKGKD